MLGDGGGGAAAAGGVEYEVAGVGGHQHTTLNDFRVGLNDVDFVSGKTGRRVFPKVVDGGIGKVIVILDLPQSSSTRPQSVGTL